jgi:hypothetical protein
MAYIAGFLTTDNFELAFQRIVNSGDGEYKNFYRHLLSAYGLALRHNVRVLISDIRSGSYAPSKPTVIYLPKRTGVLRPISLLSVGDLVVYQAIANIIARSFGPEQQKYAYLRSFGAIYAGPTSQFFFRPWKTSYRSFNSALAHAFQAGARYFAEFDLVSFYELIDHTLLRSVLLAKVKNVDTLDLLFECLRTWSGHSGGNLGHGVPQGPEASAFLAECLLLKVDALTIKGVSCLRYVDDVKLLGKNEASLRRALIHLDLASKGLGLVPQAHKIAPPRQIRTLDEILKTVPSLAAISAPTGRTSQRALFSLLRSSMTEAGQKMGCRRSYQL